MGTSSASSGTSGKGTPIVPSWVEPLEETGLPSDISDSDEDDNDAETQEQKVSAQPDQEPDPKRYTTPRSNFSEFVKSGGQNRASLGRAISGYVKTTAGGSTGAAWGMGSSRVTSSKLLSFLADSAQNGLNETLDSLNLSELIGRPIEDIFINLADHICKETGTKDDGIARNAFIETIAEITSLGFIDLNNLTLDQIKSIFETYVSRSIETRIINEIGTNFMNFASSESSIEKIETQLQEFIRNAVIDAMDGRLKSVEEISGKRVRGIVDSIYEKAFRVLNSLAEAEISKL